VDKSVVGETQHSSVPDSQAAAAAAQPPSTGVGPTPTKGKRAKGWFTDDIDADELQIRSPKHSMSEMDYAEPSSSTRRSKRRAPSSLASSKSATSSQEDCSVQEGVLNKDDDPQAQPPPAETVAPAKLAIDALRKALDMVHKAEMTAAEIGSVEDEVFEAFGKLREKKKKAKR
jgi:hypothetical protein